jgi:hypothetical protein
MEEVCENTGNYLGVALHLKDRWRILNSYDHLLKIYNIYKFQLLSNI